MDGRSNFKPTDIKQEATCAACGLPPSLCVCDNKSQANIVVDSTANNPPIQVSHSLGIVNGRYKLLEPLGEGGMGAVFKAQHTAIDKLFAVKMLKKEVLADEAMRQRFEQEAKALSKLDHPNLVSVYDYGTSETGEPYFVMDYLVGLSLNSLLKRDGALEQKRAARICMQICDGLAHAHKSDVVHRDLKPSNVMLITQNDVPDFVKVVDFGIAKLFSSTSPSIQLTQTGDLFGSPPYMSPEQCRGERLDQRSDIYSLGCVMYECLSGQAPYNAENALAVIFKHVNEDPTPLNDLGLKRKIDNRLEKIVMKCLARDPDDRYQSMYEVRMDLRKFLDGETLIPRMRPAQQLEVPSAPSNAPTLIAGIVIGALVVSGGLVTVKLLVESFKPHPSQTASATDPNAAPAAMAPIQPTEQLNHEDKAIVLYHKAQTTYDAGDLVNARKLVDASQSIDSNIPDAHLLSGLLYYRAQNFGPAHEEFTKAASYPHFISRTFALTFRGNSAMNLGRPDEAVQDANAAIAVDPRDAGAYCLKSWALNELGRYDQALVAIDSAIKIAPDNTQFKDMRKGVLRCLGKTAP